MPVTNDPISALLAAPRRHLAGTDLTLRLPLGRPLLNEILAARPADTPVEELLLDPEAGNLVNLHLAVDAPIVGSVRRKLVIRPGAAVRFPDQPWLQLNITDGFRLLDKGLIRVMQGQIADKLPAGIELTSKYLRLHVPALLKAAGYQQLIPLIRQLKIESETNRLVVVARIQAETEPIN